MRRQQNAQKRQKKMEVSQCESQTMESSLAQMNDKRYNQQEKKSRSEMQKRFKNGKENLTEWFGVVYADKVHEMVQ